jgi:hypothetical protein
VTVSFTNATTRATADDLYYASILDSSVIDAIYSTRVMAPLMRNYSLAGKPSNTAKFPRWPALTAAAVAETADLANTNIATTSVTATVGEVGITIAVTDALQEDDILSGLAGYGRQGGLALADKMDADAASLLSGFSNTTGVTTGGLTVDTVLAAIGALEARDAARPFVGVLHPVQWNQLARSIASSAATIHSNNTDGQLGVKPGFVGNWFGVDFYQSTNVPTNTRSTVAVYDGALFTKGQALVHVSKRDARSEFERDASARLSEITVTARYADAELVDEYGQVLYSNQA